MSSDVGAPPPLAGGTRDPCQDYTPRGHASRYNNDCYAGMRDDTARTEAYRRAIEEAAAGRVVVDLGTGALALLAIFAARAGAEHVYAIEVQSAAAASARRTITEAGLADKVTVLDGFSTDEAVVLPIKAELMVHELIGEIAGEEGAVAAVADALRRHMDPAALPPLSVPARVCTLLAPAEYPDAAYCAGVPSTLLAAAGSALKLPALPRSALLAPPQTCEDLRFESGRPEASQRHELRFVAARAGALRGLALHIEIHCGRNGADAEPDVSSAWAGSHWNTILLLLAGEVRVEAGQAIVVHTTAELAGVQPRYTFEAWLLAAGGARRSLGPPIGYPEAALNCNEMADLLLAEET